MPRPRANPEQHAEAYRLHNEGEGPKAIIDALREKYGDDAVSERTVATWVKGFKSLDQKVLDLDSPFQWHLTDKYDKYGLSWEAGSYLVAILNHVRALRGREEEEQKHVDPRVIVTKTPLLTVREAIWCWRVHLAAPEIGEDMGQPFSDVLYLARKFAFREIAHQVLGDPLNMADLEAILIYKPWLSVEKHDAYHKAVDEGVVTPLPSAIDVRDKVVDVFLTPETGYNPENDMTSFSKAMVYDDYPVACSELLESQQRWLWGEQIARTREAKETGQAPPIFEVGVVPEFTLREPPEVKHFNCKPDEEDDNGNTKA